MDANTQIFFDNFTTPAAQLRRVFWINEYDTTTGPRCLVRGELHELIPSYVRNATVNDFLAIRLHVLNVQLFKNNEPILIDEFSTFLMSKICSSVSLSLVSVLQRANRFSPFDTTLRQSLFLALEACNILLITLRQALAFNHFTITQYRKLRQAKIDADRFDGRCRQDGKVRLAFAREDVMYQFPTESRRTVTVLSLPTTSRCILTLTSPILERRIRPLSRILTPVA